METYNIIESFNPWWQKGAENAPNTPSFHRNLYDKIISRFKDKSYRRGIVLVGPRQVGKSTILKQLIIGLGADKNILYVSMDHPVLREKSIDDWAGEWIRERQKEHKGPLYMLWDEATFVKDWDTWMKQYLDHYENIHIIATGSSTNALTKGTQESGVGRWDRLWLPPFMFDEVLRWRFGKDFDTSKRVLIPPPQDIDTTLYSTLKEYMTRGGFPMMWSAAPIESLYDMLRRDIIERVIFHDIPLYTEIRDVSSLERLFYTIALDTGRPVSVERLSRELRIAQASIKNYLSLLTRSGLTLTTQPYPGISRRGIAGIPKITIVDPAIYSAISYPVYGIGITPDREGQLLETLLAQHLNKMLREKGGILSYWQMKDKDVDFIFKIGDEAIPIAITRSTQDRKRNENHILAFMDRYPKDTKTGLILYNGKEFDKTDERDRRISYRNTSSYLLHLCQSLRTPNT